MKAPTTPLMRQYLEIKRRHPDAILFFQVGDFYEMFYDDAEEASRLLNLTLTSRNNGEASDVPLAGVPIKAASEYVQRLIRSGRRVAICQQVEDASQAQGIVRREVVETITPGAIFSDDLLSSELNNFMAAVSGSTESGELGLAWLDASTGEFYVAVVAKHELESELDRIDPSELLLRRSWEEADVRNAALGNDHRPRTYRDDWCFDTEIAGELICRELGIQSLSGLGLGEPRDAPAVQAAGALIAYLREVQPNGGAQLRRPRVVRNESALHVDAMTRRNLEVIRPLRADSEEQWEHRGQRGQGGQGGQGRALLEILDATRTPMGSRLLRAWLLRPLADVRAINERLDAVEELVGDGERRERVRGALGAVRDLERLAGRVGAGRATPRDLLGLAGSLRQAATVLESVGRPVAEELVRAVSGYDRVEDVVGCIEEAIDPDATAAFGEGGIIRSGYSAELDDLRAVRDGAVDWIAELQARERERTGIASLKVGYNKVFGYYLEVSKANLEKTPSDYQRRQTLTNAERYVTPELKEWESKVLGAEEQIAELEQRLFRRVREEVASEVARVQELADRVSLVDVISALGQVAERNNYVRPVVDDEDRIVIRGGRHPIVEWMMPRERFVPNDVRLDGDERILILTGPNMAGKSTILRQVGLISLMAQTGCFVPADSAVLGVVDRLFTRVGASDNLAQGQSTFMVEMIETAAIVNGATDRSLVLLDEIGRGTSTYDGVSIAWAVTEYIHERINAKTVFATHYHELTQIADLLPRAAAYNVAVKEVGDEIVFLRRLEPGGADRSYGVQVARLAGLPVEVLERAREILSDLEGEDGAGRLGRRGHLPASADRWQLSLFEPEEHPVVEQLRSVDPESITPLDALALLAELRRQVRET